MKKTILFFCICSMAHITIWSQSIYQVDTIIDSETTKSIRMKIPEGVDEVEGILMMGNPWLGSVLHFVEDSMATAFAQSINFAMMGTSFWGRFKEADEFELFEYFIDSLAEMANHPEISNAPFIIFGCSNGGQMAHSYNSLRPEKCITFLVDKGGYYINPIPDSNVLKTPGMLVSGELDLQYRIDAINDLFYNNRPRGAFWSHIDYQGAGHVLVDETHYLFLVMAEAAHKLRYPIDEKPINGPVNLRNLVETDGWLSDSSSWDSGIVGVLKFGNYPDNKDSASWHINKDLACLFAAHSSYSRTDNNASLSAKVADNGDIVNFQFRINSEWDSVFVYNKSEKVGAYYGGGDSIFEFNYKLINPGFSALFSKVYLSSGDSSVTNLDVVFAKGDFDPTSAESIVDSHRVEKPYVIYPNPSAGLINVDFNNDKEALIEILDFSGRIIESINTQEKRAQIKINRTGLFLVRIKQSRRSYFEKVIVR